jgi:hypothetical protein
MAAQTRRNKLSGNIAVTYHRIGGRVSSHSRWAASGKSSVTGTRVSKLETAIVVNARESETH